MKRLFSLVIFICILTLINCGRDYPTIVNLYVGIWLRDNKLNNLLNSETIDYYKKEDIRVFYIDNGEKKEFFNRSLGAPRNFTINKNEGNGEYAFRLFVYEGKSRSTELTTTLVQWRSGVVDTLKSEITKFDNSTIVTKVWYNGVLKFDDATAKSTTWGNAIVRQFIEIRK